MILSAILDIYLTINFSYCNYTISKTFLTMLLLGYLKHYDEFILLGKGEEKLKGNKKPSILADAFEAVLAAIFLDSDFQTAQEFVRRNLDENITKELNSAGGKDHKTKLQELLQGRGVERIVYEIVAENGPDHHKEYEAIVRVKDNVLGRGKGNNKKEAEQSAACEALSNV